MRIVFSLPDVGRGLRARQLTYEALQDGCGFSGTETAVLEVAACLAVRGHDVTVLVPPSSPADVGPGGARLVPSDEAERQPGFFDGIDVYCPILQDMRGGGAPPPVAAAIWVWMHVFESDQTISDLAAKTGGKPVMASFPTEFVAREYAHLGDATLYSRVTVGNAVGAPFIELEPQPPEIKRGNWTFHASFERGGAVARRVFDAVRFRSGDAAKTLHYASYYEPDNRRCTSSSSSSSSSASGGTVEGHGSLSKRAVAALLAGSDYFVYPLVLGSGVVHHDTYGTVVLEALAMGVIVVAWRVAGLPSAFGDHVIFVDPPMHPGYDPFARFGSNPAMLGDAAVDALAEAVLDVERAGPEAKEARRRKAMAWARTQTWEERTDRYEAWLLASFASPSFPLSRSKP